MNDWGVKAMLCAAGLVLPGCFIVTDDDEPRRVGTLTVEWTIDGIQDPNDCAVFGVDRLELLLYTRFEELIDEINPLCESFILSVDLVEGRYHADATLVDSFDRAATLTEPLDNLDIIEDTDLEVLIDFPLESFL
jgi:hypothetical protein